ncbi:SRPBCC family protein [Arthrobacter crusticola]|uniref:SRPBCC family protein n=1 Tax=Arthrobacter crusticola TaxID=2547960 RepID=A0A4R5U3D7_9MICC|nr:SRPBCC family protein [Arthrobacter crusticola]TDK28123.1 SRPBCC family protein [Arthrobacter crusticola]
MSTKVEKRILVNVPVSTAYNQWTQFEDFPQFMGGIKSVTQLSDDRLEWVAEIGGIRRQWEARILEQVPDRKVSWAATEGATNAGSVTFEDVGGGQTSVTLFLEYEPEGIVEKVGDKLNVVEKQAEGDLERFKAFIESEGYASGAWRGSVNEGGAVGTPGVEHAAESRGDSGKAGVSGKVVAGAVGLAAAAAVGAAAAGRSKDSETEVDQTATPVTPVTTTPVTGSVGAPTVVSSDEVADRDVSTPFDQTNGLADVDGDSDGTAQSDTTSAADRLTDRGDDPLRGDGPVR